MADSLLESFSKLPPFRLFVISFLLLIFFGTLALKLPVMSRPEAAELTWIDSFFTVTSAVCVTGLIVRDTPKQFSIAGQVVILVLIQAGGLSVLILYAIFLLAVGSKLGLTQMFQLKDIMNLNKMGEGHRLIKTVLLVTFFAELIGALCLFIGFQKQLGLDFLSAAWLSIFHSVSAFCNAGFALFTDNLIPFQSNYLINLTIMGLIILGGLGFIVYLDVWNLNQGRFREFDGKKLVGFLTLHTKLVFVATLFLIAIGFFGFMIFEWNNPATLGPLTWSEKFLAALFQSVTCRTAGFNTLDFGKMAGTSLFFSIFLMLVGASPGSTGGGIKTTTFSVIFLGVLAALQQKQFIQVFKREINWSIVNLSFAIAVIYLGVWFVGCLIFVWLEPGLDLFKIIFEVSSAMGTVGLSTGITPNLGLGAKVILIFLMFFGRVGPSALYLGLLPELAGSFTGIRYSKEHVGVG